MRQVSHEPPETNPGTIPACPGHCGCGGVRGVLCARVGKCVAWCSWPRWGGWGSLTLSPPGESPA